MISCFASLHQMYDLRYDLSTHVDGYHLFAVLLEVNGNMDVLFDDPWPHLLLTVKCIMHCNVLRE